MIFLNLYLENRNYPNLNFGPEEEIQEQDGSIIEELIDDLKFKINETIPPKIKKENIKIFFLDNKWYVLFKFYIYNYK